MTAIHSNVAGTETDTIGLYGDSSERNRTGHSLEIETADTDSDSH